MQDEIRKRIRTTWQALPKATEGHITEEALFAFEDIFSRYTINSVFEIGFNAGHSAAVWLEMNPKLNLYSIDIGRHDYTEEGVRVISERYKNRFVYNKMNSSNFRSSINKNLDVDLIFIDGAHSPDMVKNDIELGLFIGAKYFLFDDFNGSNVNSVPPTYSRLKQIKLYHTQHKIALYEDIEHE